MMQPAKAWSEMYFSQLSDTTNTANMQSKSVKRAPSKNGAPSSQSTTTSRTESGADSTRTKDNNSKGANSK